MCGRTAFIMTLVGVCYHQSGSDFDPKVGQVVKLEDLFITSITGRSVSDPSREGYLLSQKIIRESLVEGDKVADNYCHGDFIIKSLEEIERNEKAEYDAFMAPLYHKRVRTRK